MILARSTAIVPAWRLPAAGALARPLARAALLAAIGVELAVLAAYLPDTVRQGWNGPIGDFHNLYIRSRHLDLMNLYSPAVTLALFPIARLPELAAFRAWFVINVLCVLAAAYLAQACVRGAEARIAAALAVLSLPQMHYALRLGHLTPLLTLAALAGFLLMRRNARWGAVVLSLLSLKPQYAVAPFLWLLVRRQWRLAATMLAAAAAMATVAFVAIGPGSVVTFARLWLDWGPDSTNKLLPTQQSWMYSWPGFLISAGLRPDPLLTLDLLALSAAVVVVAWLRVDAAKGAAVAALAMIPLTPYAQFYDAGLLAAAFALILHAGLRPGLAAAIVAALYAAAVVTQANTIFPVRDMLADAHTDGLYWLTPALLLAIGAIAMTGRAPEAPEAGRW